MIEQLSMGSVNLVLPGSTLLTSYDKRFGIWDIPFLFTSYEAIDTALAGDLGQQWDSWMDEYGYHSFGIIPTGFRGLSNSKHEVKTADDMKGLKIRVMDSSTYVDTFNALGANTVTMNYSDVYSALQQGVIDGQDNPAEFTVSAGFYELQDYYTRLNHVMCMMPVFTSTDYYDGLSDDQRAAIDQGVSEMVASLTQTFRDNEDGFVKEMADSGVQITELTDEEMQTFVDKVGSVHDNFRKDLGDELFDLCLSYSE
jgi:tripartite ATP-independent transporter DctP family solute receptor